MLPVSIVTSLVFVFEGVPQNLSAYVDATTLEGMKQTIAQGPVASQEVIKVLGTNGGGFFNANSAHPYENPTALTNLIQMLLLIGIAAGLTNVLGRMVGDQRQGWAIFGAMAVLLLLGIVTVYWAEAHGNPAFAPYHIDAAPSALQAGGNMEGKEVRFGITPSALFATVTTDAGGAVDAVHDSFLPLGGMVLVVNMALGEVTFGGVGSGLYGMLAFAIVTMFVAGLMVGRTPEYLGKKLEAREVKMTMLSLLSYSLSILGWTALAAAVPQGIGGDRQLRPAWVHRDPLRLRVGHRQQRQLLCRPLHQHALLQHGSRRGDADGAVRLCDPPPRGCRLAGSEEARRPVGRVRSDPQSAICGIAGRRRADHGRPRLFPRYVARTRD